jgi:hypothetical protein
LQRNEIAATVELRADLARWPAEVRHAPLCALSACPRASGGPTWVPLPHVPEDGVFVVPGAILEVCLMIKRGLSPLFGRLFLVIAAVTLTATVLTLGAFAAPAPAPYANGFENAADVDSATYPDDAMHSVSRVASGTDGIDSAADIYLDTSLSTTGADLRFDWDSAISNTSGTFRRDFVFNVGTNGSGGFVMSASNNAGRSGADPANPGRSPYTISTSGWYTFQHHFYDAGGDVLAVDLSVRNLGAATPLQTWTLTDPTDVIGTTVGGNQYGWLVNNELPLALDNVTRSGITAPICTPTGLFRDGVYLTARQIGGDVTGTLDASTCNIGVYYGPGTSGSVSDADISGANYYGVVANAAAVDVTHTSIHDIGETPLNGSQHGVGVLYTTIDQAGVSTGSAATGTLSGTTITNYQKNGVVVSGSGASVTVQNNTVTGQGRISYIAQNGIQISFGASATVAGNTVSKNFYVPKSFVACGLLFYQAAGVKQTGNLFSENESNLCNVGRGGGNTNP